MRYHPTPVSMAFIKKPINNKRWRAWGEKGSLLHCWWECKLAQSLWRNVWRFLTKVKIEPPYDPVIPLMDIYLKETMIQKDTCSPVFSATLFTIAKTWKRVNPPTIEWIKSTNNKWWRGYRKNGTLLHCWWECKLVQPLRKTVWSFLKTLENRATIWFHYFVLQHISGVNYNSKRYIYSSVHCSIF